MVKGKRCYFGKVSADPKGEAAIQAWLRRRDGILTGQDGRRASAASETRPFYGRLYLGPILGVDFSSRRILRACWQ
jgi:hypothetical protein